MSLLSLNSPYQIQETAPLFSYRKFWAHRFGTAPFLPTNQAEMDILGWDACDIVLITGDAYIDHPSFGMALIGRLLEAQGFRVGILEQPDWHSAEPFRALGKPQLFYGVTAGNMDSLVNHYTSDRKIRRNDAYTANAESGKRPDRAVLVYSQRAREAFKEVPIIIGGIEASLRRIAQYDYWSEKVRASVLPDSKADMLLFGNAERAIVEIAHRLAKGEAIQSIQDIRGTALMVNRLPEYDHYLDAREPSQNASPVSHPDPYAVSPKCKTSEMADEINPELDKASAQAQAKPDRKSQVLILPSYEQVKNNPYQYAHASRIFHLETNPGNARIMIQQHGKRYVRINPPPLPLSTKEMDAVYGLPYARNPHPKHEGLKIPAWEMIRFSVNIMRGCFGGCTFCSITEHEGRIIQSRSLNSIREEVEAIRDQTEGFTGTISDLGGPTANMYRLQCKDKAIETHCRRLSCVYPEICKNLNTDHTPLIELYRHIRSLPGIKRVLIASGLRYDLAVKSPEYVKELVTHHVGGYLKIAPEHTETEPLSKMMKPGIGTYDTFKAMFEKFSKEAKKEQYLIPYFIAAHPGTRDQDMLQLALWLKKNQFRPDQVQSFLPTPMALASTMYHTGYNPLKNLKVKEKLEVIRKGKQRSLHKAFLRYHDPENWPILREALKKMGRQDLIGNGKKHLVPSWQPKNTEAHRQQASFSRKKPVFDKKQKSKPPRN